MAAGSRATDRNQHGTVDLRLQPPVYRLHGERGCHRRRLQRDLASLHHDRQWAGGSRDGERFHRVVHGRLVDLRTLDRARQVNGSVAGEPLRGEYVDGVGDVEGPLLLRRGRYRRAVPEAIAPSTTVSLSIAATRPSTAGVSSVRSADTSGRTSRLPARCAHTTRGSRLKPTRPSTVASKSTLSPATAGSSVAVALPSATGTAADARSSNSSCRSARPPAVIARRCRRRPPQHRAAPGRQGRLRRRHAAGGLRQPPPRAPMASGRRPASGRIWRGRILRADVRGRRIGAVSRHGRFLPRSTRHPGEPARAGDLIVRSAERSPDRAACPWTSADTGLDVLLANRREPSRW